MKGSIAILVVAIAAAGCRDTTGPLLPSQYVGMYALRTVNAQRVPALVATTLDGCAWGYQAGVLTLAAGVFQLHLSQYAGGGCAALDTIQLGDTVVILRFGETGLRAYQDFYGRVDVQGDRLALTYIEPTRADGATGAIEARLSAGVLTLIQPAGSNGLTSPTELGFALLPTASAVSRHN